MQERAEKGKQKLHEQLLRIYVRTRTTLTSVGRDQRGEGVISAAIAVLIMAALGALMWVGFKAMWGNTSSQTTDQLNQIGR